MDIFSSTTSECILLLFQGVLATNGKTDKTLFLWWPDQCSTISAISTQRRGMPIPLLSTLSSPMERGAVKSKTRLSTQDKTPVRWMNLQAWEYQAGTGLWEISLAIHRARKHWCWQNGSAFPQIPASGDNASKCPNLSKSVQTLTHWYKCETPALFTHTEPPLKEQEHKQQNIVDVERLHEAWSMCGSYSNTPKHLKLVWLLLDLI